jgi:hypothetical protein
MGPVMERDEALRTEREGTFEMAARALRFRNENAGRFVVASTPYCTTPVRHGGGAYRLDNFLDDPATFADRAEADKLAARWNDNLRADRQDTMVSVYAVEDFYTTFMDELDSTLLFSEQEAE